MRRTRYGVAVGAALVGLLGTTAGASPTGGLPQVTSGPRPGPDALYAPALDAPQLQNTGVWHAAPVLVGGGESYRDGEWVYQDFLHDDHGATGSKDPNDPFGAGAHLFSPAGGTYTYPTDPVYADNAADLVELRTRPLASGTAFRVTLDTLKDASRTGFTIALGSSGTAIAWPHGAGVSSPARLFLTVHGSSGELRDAATGLVLDRPRPTVDLARRQVTVTVPHTAWDPGAGKVRVSVGVGLWDVAADSYLAPAVGAATATTPGGGRPGGAALVNVGPRTAEPLPSVKGGGYTIADTAVLGAVQAAWWRERQQSQQLALGDVTPFAADVDFGKLRRHVRDDSAVPSTGTIERIFASRHSFGQGVDPSRVCFDLAKSFALGANCIGRFVGQLQQYVLYVPAKPAPARGRSLTLLLHSLSANENQYAASHNQSELGDRGDGSLVLTPAGRGPDGFYAGMAEADTFEAWADVARHYRLDRDRAVVTGYSMGGFGTYRLLARWPDLFARGFSVVGAPGSVADQLPSLQNTPLLAWNSTADELVNLKTSEDAVSALKAAGVRFEEDLFANADHLTLAANDEYGPGVAFLGDGRVDRNPARVRYVVDRTEDNAAALTVADHAYWLSAIRSRGNGDATVDALSLARGTARSTVTPVATGGGVLTGGAYPMVYVSRTQAFAPAAAMRPTDALVLTLTNVRSLTVDPRRAGLTCGTALRVTTDGPVTVTLAGCGRAVRFG